MLGKPSMTKLTVLSTDAHMQLFPHMILTGMNTREKINYTQEQRVRGTGLTLPSVKISNLTG